MMARTWISRCGMALWLGLTASAPAWAADDDATLVARGRDLAIAADCMACHTAKGGKPYAGGYAIESPLGTIYSSNITPSTKTGIGNYSEQDFARALREGVRKDGAHLYPAMPYTSYTQLSDEDVKALYTYFMKGVQPVEQPTPVTQLPFPFNIRLSMMGWNMLFLDNKRFVPDASKSQEINRGAYLANALAHCGSCHTPRNVLMAEDVGRALGGGRVGPWYAPNISSDPVAGIGGWTDAELVQYLRTGHTAGKGQAGGPMAEAVENSFQHMSESDLHAIVAYLRSTPAVPAAASGAGAASYAQGQAASSEAERRGVDRQTANQTLKSGAALYSGYCASCHQASGAGSGNQAYPSLFHNSATGGETAINLLATIVFGIDREAGGEHVLMPSFGQGSYVNPLTDEEIASIANYVLANYGNAKLTVTPADVREVRTGGPTPPLAKARPFLVPGGAVAVLAILLLVILAVRRYRRR
ncbi:cytochrome C [Bordetella genomosp. 10]|uniref:Cytochrome C n=1 Tax=Bordetella genomosp. 10 TaxID=1416804 RepID=A0A261S0W8_9BORD|nr:cytochrome c [Bordetella genomosp. 10]OZI30994.1 cytochrome C [Bordetella genomosp. 10]